MRLFKMAVNYIDWSRLEQRSLTKFWMMTEKFKQCKIYKNVCD